MQCMKLDDSAPLASLLVFVVLVTAVGDDVGANAEER